MPLWMEVMVLSRWRRAVGRGKGKLGPVRLLVVLSLEQPSPGRLGTTSQPTALSAGLQIIELDLYQQKVISSLFCCYTTANILFSCQFVKHHLKEELCFCYVNVHILWSRTFLITYILLVKGFRTLE